MVTPCTSLVRALPSLLTGPLRLPSVATPDPPRVLQAPSLRWSHLECGVCGSCSGWIWGCLLPTPLDVHGVPPPPSRCCRGWFTAPCKQLWVGAGRVEPLLTLAYGFCESLGLRAARRPGVQTRAPTVAARVFRCCRLFCTAAAPSCAFSSASVLGVVGFLLSSLGSCGATFPVVLGCSSLGPPTPHPRRSSLGPLTLPPPPAAAQSILLGEVFLHFPAVSQLGPFFSREFCALFICSACESFVGCVVCRRFPPSVVGPSSRSSVQQL